MKETKDEYDDVLGSVEAILQKATKLGGFENLTPQEAQSLASLSQLIEKMEDSVPLMPIKTPQTLPEMIRLKMFEMKIKQKQLAELLGLSESYISRLLSSGKSASSINMKVAKKLHDKLGIDGDFILKHA